jgi:hypothetical protein
MNGKERLIATERASGTTDMYHWHGARRCEETVCFEFGSRKLVRTRKDRMDIQHQSILLVALIFVVSFPLAQLVEEVHLSRLDSHRRARRSAAVRED